jgi:Bacterial regulatory proteins, tetR family
VVSLLVDSRSIGLTASMMNSVGEVKGTTKRAYSSALRAEMAERTKVMVVRAALTEFLERGYAGTTIDRIAARAGVSRPPCSSSPATGR